MTKALATIPRTGRARDGSRRGGARPGSGPKPGPAALLIGDYQKAARNQVGPRLFELLDQLVELAMGVRVIGPDGEPTEAYVVPPDRQACIYLIDRVLGKPTEHREVSGPEGTPIPFSIISVIDKVYGGGEA